jgi:hypothetical protein
MAHQDLAFAFPPYRNFEHTARGLTRYCPRAARVPQLLTRGCALVRE